MLLKSRYAATRRDLAADRPCAPARPEGDQRLALKPAPNLATSWTWAEDVRAPAPATWHHTSFSRDAGCHNEAAVLRVGGSCVVSATGRQFVALASKAPDEERLMAVTFVAPVAGNVHRPLRTGYADDRRSSCQRQALQRGTSLRDAIDAEAFSGYHPNLASVARAHCTAMR